MKIIGIILFVIGVTFVMFWFDLLKKKEYLTDPNVFWLTFAFAILIFYLTILCFK